MIKAGSSIGLLCILALQFASSAFADFRFSAQGSYSNADSPGSDQDLYGVSITGFLKPVSDSRGPLAEAAFLSRSSRLTYSYTRDEADTEQTAFVGIVGSIDALVPSETRTDGNLHRLSGRYVFPNSGWIVGAGVQLEDRATNLVSVGMGMDTSSSDTDGWSAGLTFGRYLLAQTSLTLSASFGSNDTDSESSDAFDLLPGLPGGEFLFESRIEQQNDRRDVALILEHVGAVGNGSFRANVNIGYSATDTELRAVSVISDTSIDPPAIFSEAENEMDLGTAEAWRAGIGGTWYFTRTLGLSAAYEYNDLGFLETHNYSGGLRWFATSYIELSARYGVTDFDGFGSDPKMWRVALRGRF